MRDREDVLKDRRSELDKATSRDLSLWYRKETDKLWADRPELRKIYFSKSLRIFVTCLPLTILEDDGEVPEADRIWDEQRQIERICSNPECLAIQWKSVPEGRTQTGLKRCSKCSITFYCSVSIISPGRAYLIGGKQADCQKKDWKRHKAEPCLPYDEMVNNDDIWTEFGIRKKTGNSMFKFADDE